MSQETQYPLDRITIYRSMYNSHLNIFSTNNSEPFEMYMYLTFLISMDTLEKSINDNKLNCFMFVPLNLRACYDY